MLGNTYKVSTCFGSVLPDLKPSFLTTRHEYIRTFDKFEEFVTKLAIVPKQGFYYHVQLGEAIHYLADYFTFPHNVFYTGTLAAHCVYEGELKTKFKEYIRGVNFSADYFEEFNGVDDLISYVRNKHEEYSKLIIKIEIDCAYIFDLCCQVIYSILTINKKQNLRTYKVA